MSELERRLREQAEVIRGMLPPDLLSKEEWVLAHGRSYASEPLTSEEWAMLRACLAACARDFPIKQCFQNAQSFGLACQELPCEWPLVYVEGYVMKQGIPLPIHHAWLDLNGKVVDVTLRVRPSPRKRGRLGNRNVGTFCGYEYHGGVIPWTTVRTHVLSTCEWSTILDDHKNRWPLLRRAV